MPAEGWVCQADLFSCLRRIQLGRKYEGRALPSMSCLGGSERSVKLKLNVLADETYSEMMRTKLDVSS